MPVQVLHVGPVPPPYGGVAVLLSRLLGSPLRGAYDLIVLNTSKPGQGERPDEVEGKDVVHTVLHLGRFVSLLARRRPPIVHIQGTADVGFYRDALFILIARLFGRKVIVHLHGAPDSKLPRSRSPWGRPLFGWVLRRAHRVVVLTPGFRAAFAPLLGEERLRVVPNLVDPDAAHAGTGAAASTSGAPASGVRLLFVGRLSREKGFDDLLEIAPALLARAPGLTLTAAGGTEVEGGMEEIRLRIERLGMTPVVRLPGRVPNEQIHALYRDADLFLLPTHNDIFPLAILEAMAAGIPIISTRVGAIPEVVRDGENGLLVDAGDRKALEAAILRLAGDPPLRARIGERNRAEARARYSIAAGAALVRGIYEELLAPAGERGARREATAS